MNAYKRAEQMWSQKFAPGTDICSEIAACIDAAVAEERAAVVAWLFRQHYDDTATRIERGEHRREETG